MAFILVRALTYATIFVSLLLVLLPAGLLERSGVVAPVAVGWPQMAGLVIATAGAALALWCVLIFALVGRGTPAPFDPPRRLVVRGPYRVMRNPMYAGAILLLAGVALYYGSTVVLTYTGLFWLVTHAFVVAYEEPTLRRMFGGDYEAYCRRVRRWRPW